MARDLIPPPSPAGRPQPEGTPRLIELPPDPPPPVIEPAPTDRGPLPPSRFRNRFGFMVGALAGVVVAASLVLAVVLTTGGGQGLDERLAPNWSRWQPSDTSLDGGAAQIAEHVGAKYKHSSGEQLVLVQGSALPQELSVAVRSGRITQMDGTVVVYRLNGLGPNNSIKIGKPSAARLKVLQREGLELALYTFRYLRDADMVLITLPPPPPEDDQTGLTSVVSEPTQQIALFYRPGDLLAHLRVPLGHTVPAKAPTPETLDPAEGRTIDALTNSNRFLWSVQEGNGLIVLERPPSP